MDKLDTQTFYKVVVQFYRQLPESFPTTGTIRKSGSYAYLDIGKQRNNYIRVTLRLMNLFHLLERIGVKNTQLVAPPSPVGAHVTLHNVPTADVGKELHFKLGRIVDWEDHRQGTKPSGFNHHIYPMHWFALSVDGIPKKYYGGDPHSPHLHPGDRPHISMAMLAYVH